jgi:transcriptional regulator with XRE-family HTH domain
LHNLHLVIILNTNSNKMTKPTKNRAGPAQRRGEKARGRGIGSDDPPAAQGGKGGVSGALAANVRRRREAAGLSLAQLAELAGIAKGTVFAIEAGEANPTVDTVYALAAALGCPMVELLADTPDPMLVEVRGSGRKERIGALNGRRLQRFTPTGPVEVIEVSLTTTATTRSRPHAHGVYEHVWVAGGRIRLGPTNDPFELDAGDYVCFPGWHEHAYRPLEPPVQLLMLLSYVRSVPALAHSATGLPSGSAT